MSYSENPYQYKSDAAVGNWGNIAAQAPASERTDFIRKTYLHLAGAVLAFIGLEAILLQTSLGDQLFQLMAGSRYGYLFIILGFIAVAYISEMWARSATSVGMQYAGLSLYVVAESVIFLPLLYMASKTMPEAIPQAAAITAVLFGGLTAIVFVTGQDFSFLRTFLMLVGLASIVVVIWAMVTGHPLGLFYISAMILFACGYILYDTSNVLHHYRIGQHVAASLALFASVALLFWYVLRLLMSLNRR